MKRLRVVLLILLAVFAFGSLHRVCGQGGFIIQDADATNSLSFTPSSVLQIPTRIVFRHAQANRHITLNEVPSALGTLIENVEPRLIVRHARANWHLSLVSVPSELETLLSQLVPRLILQFASGSRDLQLNYPTELIDDNQAPQVTNLDVAPGGETSAIVSWTTDEFADSTVRCGTESGTYTMEVSDPLYVKAHALTLTGLTAETTYYCRVSSTDLSGNTYQSDEFTFEQADDFFIYLPLVLRSY